ncbi:MAG TPA: Rieske 2Fe-2S domain-containing protein, partial [Ferruginibacter sp.]|nr:Rieske 2Fe-2S domain-containing protein [Ferruginibacter sp.]
TGHEGNCEACFTRLESYVRRHFDVEEISFRWSSQYYEPTDGLAYIGLLPGHEENIYVATGFGGNGMIYGTISGIALSDLMQDQPSPYAKLFDPSRIKPVAGFSNFVKEAADVVAELVTGRFGADAIKTVGELAAGEAKVVKFDNKTIALYKDEAHNLHAVSPACTHIKCTVGWNNAEQTWDCPCHGSRFSVDGEMLTGPARKDLQRFEIFDSE